MTSERPPIRREDLEKLERGRRYRAVGIAVEGNRALYELDDGQTLWIRTNLTPQVGRRGVLIRGTGSRKSGNGPEDA